MNLRYYLLRRLLFVIPVLIGLSLLTFSISRVVPGDPVGLAAGPQATDAIREALREEFGLDQPLPVQYLNYIQYGQHGLIWLRTFLKLKNNLKC